MERLQKVIAESGYCSRRKAEELISSGKVSVNGSIVSELGTKVSGDDIILVENNPIKKEDKVYYLLNKPRGVVSTVDDEFDRKKITDLIDTDKRIYPVGRLDYDTTGIIILTNDGELANILMHPSKSVEKTYVAKLNKVITPKDQMILKSGVKIDDVKCIPTRVKVKNVDTKKDTCLVEITIVEGRNHIVKRVFESLGYLVDKLTRTEYAFLRLDNLKSGEYRELTTKEVKKLYEYKR
ncbi:MAG: rRNA pseudouridine synthase [Erysipelotrichales bacterium]|nr:rRNA pseudouridine synthase [Erysipelotrichales bacterium]